MILIGDVRQRLAELPDCSVDCVVTSPPYWGLRDYGTASWDGGDSSCDHKGKPMATKANINRNCGTGNDVKNATAREFYKDICGRCGATRIDSQLGLEQTPEEYVAQMVAVFREVKRVLRDDGTLWLNIGDTYSSHKDCKSTAQTLAKGGASEMATVIEKGKSVSRNSRVLKSAGYKNKDLVGIPWMLAFALRADGWYLRQDIIWAKPNPMPESVRDRCTKSHEYIFLLTKQPKYYYDDQAIQEDAKTKAGATWQERKAAGATAGNVIVGDGTRNGTQRVVHGKGVTSNLTRQDGKRNRRSVWTVTTKPFKGAHFATFPPQLIEPCILAGCPEGGTVLDPFFGAGTTGLVAQRNNRRWIGCELNPEYAEIARKRIEAESNMFTEQSVIVII